MPISDLKLAEIRRKQDDFLTEVGRVSQLWTKTPSVDEVLEAGEAIDLEPIMVSEFIIYWVNRGELDSSYEELLKEIRARIDLHKGDNDDAVLSTEASYGTATQSLRIFLCHGSEDKPAVRSLYDRLTNEGEHPWLDEQDILPGEEWGSSIESAIKDSHIVLVCLSRSSIGKTGFVNKEIGFALDKAEEMPEGKVYIVPAKLEDCEVPKRLQKWQWVDLYVKGGFERLVQTLNNYRM